MIELTEIGLKIKTRQWSLLAEIPLQYAHLDAMRADVKPSHLS